MDGLNHVGIYSFFYLTDDFLEKHKIQIRNGLRLAPLVIGLAGSWEGEANSKMIQASLVKYLRIFTLSVYKYLFSKMCNINHLCTHGHKRSSCQEDPILCSLNNMLCVRLHIVWVILL